jgi:hypothetical protein
MNDDDKMTFNENDPVFGKTPRMSAPKNSGGLQGKLVSIIIKLFGGQMTENQAMYVILGILAVMFIISFILFKNALY